MNTKQRKTLKAKIIEKISELEQEITVLSGETKPIPPDCSLGRLGRLDSIRTMHMSEAALVRAQKKLVQLQQVVKTVHDEEYGECLECGILIPYQRLHLIPETTLCVKCAQNHE